VVLEGANGPFGRVDPMFFGGHTLEAYLIFLKGVLQILRALVVKDVEFWRMSLMH
jgi:hypothetical protein